ncbi:MAG: transglycosylase domain-containing protein, partial [Sphingomonas bacterium]|nr:transglycosylase domain-containing protein [Sphingomonas bacterium]
MSEATGIWQKGGRDVEQIDDPFTPAPPPPSELAPAPTKRRQWLKIVLYSTFVFMVLIVGWLVISAPLGRALEPLADPAMLLLSEEGRPIARRGAIKEAPVEVAKLDPLTPAAFIAIEDRRFHSHWGIDPRAIGRAMVANFSAGGVRQGGSTLTQQLAKT